ncbi:unnamed protein product [Caenorhabditis bovis]|uniref:Uncharacterized protein n=1 Tax=Caenorhabditis bovis TaxID=2654633 RepID=A0A8S1EYS0_9PELO|nr:unnamed protein product [Caenorhabditis bovis]
MRIPILILLAMVPNGRGQYGEETPNYCADYVECAAVSVLEERLCLGNSVWRPYWLPDRHDPKKCHEKLKNDYIMLERLEEELDTQLNACLMENSKPLENADECSRIAKSPKFSFGRTITYVPTRCFTGLKNRIKRQCGALAKCCPALSRCRLLTLESTLQKMINTTTANLKKRAVDCEKGLEVAPLTLENHQFSTDSNTEDIGVPGPSGNVVVNFRDQETLRKQMDDDKSKASGFVNVRFHTQDEHEAHANKVLIRYGDNEPKLSYPERVADFEKKYNKAMKHTKYYKDRISELDKIVNQGVESLIDAATVSDTAPPMGTVTLSASNDDQNLVVEDFGSGTEAVTSSPIIFVEKENEAGVGQAVACKPMTSFRFQRILELLGEKNDSDDMMEIRKLVKNFEEKLKGKTLSAEQMNKAKLIEKSLEMLIQHFEVDDFHKIANDTDKILSSDIPVCNSSGEPEGSGAVDVSESLDGETATMLVDDNGDKFLINQGATALIVGEANTTSLDDVENVTNFISDEYRREIQEFRKQQMLWSMKNGKGAKYNRRNETTCDMYMRCRSQMHLAVDSCAWRFASDQLLATMAESAESLLFKDDGMCSQKDGEQYTSLYEAMIGRNDKLRECLDEKNAKFFEQSVCLAYPEDQRKTYEAAVKRLLDADYPYQKSLECFKDANLVQEKCSKLRDCCPNFDVCRETTFDAESERTIINLTARLNAIKQDCVKAKAKSAVKLAVRQLLLSNSAGRHLLQLGLDISRGARVVRMAKYRE